MPYDTIIAVTLIFLVLLVPVLKWAKDKKMEKRIGVVPISKLGDVNAVCLCFSGDDDFLKWYLEHELELGTYILEGAGDIRAHYLKVVEGKVMNLRLEVKDLMLKPDLNEEDIKSLKAQVGKIFVYLDYFQASALLSELRRLKLRQVELAGKQLDRASKSSPTQKQPS